MSENIINQVFVFLLAGGKGERLYSLTVERAKPAVPFGGKYRVIDFTLSNCINSGFRKIAVATQYKSSSLSRHLALSWAFLSSNLGEYVTDLPPQQRYGEKWYSGTADAIYQNLYFLDREKPKYVMVLSGDHIYKMDYKKMLEFHIEKGADTTIGTVIIDKTKSQTFGIMQVDKEYRIIGFREKPKSNPPVMPEDQDKCLASMGIYIFNTNTLIDLLDHDERIETSSHDFGRDIIPYAISTKLRLFAFKFLNDNGSQGYWQDIGTIDAFYESNMDLLSESPKIDIYDKSWPFFTHPRHHPPARFTYGNLNGGKINSLVEDSIVGEGTILKGSTVKHSIIFYDVSIDAGSVVDNSIIFSETRIGRNVKIKRAIIDKLVEIPDNVKIGYDLDFDKKYFYVTPSNIIIIPRSFKFSNITSTRGDLNA
ncbi:MAG: glucose-1-phosphate adenylyltransferase [Caldiserica bacterium CG23_combo_of_CG06-09_8_20_14_all_35_60]|nr:MAG: glucose-1-phosphate adenylyltransferase [Caldiserica bacterium CG23_combo_of_CG06-09_8_20_14_all_35_60]PIX28612.1 MAG: glucose-1-phosphate adenylyltransferase [Caldiserica bacterium CG_4_8_14_3_um_filter_35_18]